jgi:23S rRNA (cytosine1962-C5)-methyltransferase
MVLTRHQHHQSRLPKYDIHPISIKMLEQGNPWVTKDKFSEKFHPKERFIVALNRKRPFALLLHDPTHNTVKARLWSKGGNYEKQIKNFKNDLAQRIHSAFKSRKDQNIMDSRDNLYLLFGEGDQVPGLFVQYLGGEILIQYYANFWERYQDYVIQTVIKKMSDVFKMDILKMQVWVQKRVEGMVVKEPPHCLDPNTTYKNITINEFGAKYKVNLGQHYDIGIYTDMSSVRNTLKPHFEGAKSVLNLYSYTGAFSLFAMAHGAQKVTSIDLSSKYLEWLDENIALNDELKSASHTTMAVSALEGLKELQDKNEKYDLIICDPPSSSSDGQKRTNALKDYEKLLPAMYDLLTENGKIVVFLNTHKINKKKFQFKLHDIIKYHKLPLRTGKFLGLNQDCPAMPRFPEGSYLKGYVIEVDKKRLEKKYAPKNESEDETKLEAKSEISQDSTDQEKPKAKSPAAKKKATKKVAKKVTKKVTKEVSEAGAKKKTTKKIAKKAAKKVTKKVTKKATKKATKKVTKKATKKKA